MKILIVGSIHHKDDEAIREKFKEACITIGAELVRSKIELVVGSTNERTADRWVLEGAAKVKGNHKVWLFRPEESESPNVPIGDLYAGNFKVIHKRLKGPWAGGRVSQILEADGVLMIGGGRGAAQVGYSAMALEKPVLAVASFGGSAKEAWSQFDPFYQKLSQTKEEFGHMRENWQMGNEKLVVSILRELVTSGVFRRSKLVADLTPMLLNLVLIATWVWLFVEPPIPGQASFFALLCVSAFLGTGLRRSLSIALDQAIPISRKAAIAEFSAGLILAFALGLLSLAGSFTFTGTIQDLSNLDGYQRLAVTMGILGVTGGWLLERVSDKLKNLLSDNLSED